MKFATCMAAVFATVAMSAHAQTFVDLDFDAAQLPGPPGSFSFLTWDQGAPGWGHPDGDSTGHVSYAFGNVGYSQSYVLLLSPFGSASGAYGFGLKSGSFH